MNKRILFLGGSYTQIPIIKEAKNRGWHVVTCDYFPNNPGHLIADEYYNISTTDMDGVLQLAKNLKPDYIVAYASDPAAPIAAYVSEKLGLPGNPYQSVRVLAEKDLFRKLLKGNGFNSPNFITISEKENALEKVKDIKFPYIIKPTDSSGSKGVTRIDCKEQIEKAVQYAFSFSRIKHVIVEEFIDNEIADLHGDGFVVNGKLAFLCLGDHLYNTGANPFNPVGTLWPTKQPMEMVQKIHKDVKRIVKICGFQNGAINVEARMNRAKQIYIMEIGPRSGGHFVPQAIEYSTGFNMIKATLDRLTGLNIVVPNHSLQYSAYYAVHSNKAGILKKLTISNELKPNIKEFNQYVYPGQNVKSFLGAESAIGIILFVFKTRNEMEHYLLNIGTYVTIEIYEQGIEKL